MKEKSSWKSFCGYFRADLRRFFLSPNWIIASVCVVPALFFSTYSLFGERGLHADSDVLGIYTMASQGMGAMLIFVFCTCAFGMTFSEDLEDGFDRYAIIRGRRFPYILARAVVIYLGALIVMVLGSFLFLMFCRIRMPWVAKDSAMLTALRQADSGYRFLWGKGHYLLYCLTEAFFLGLFAGTLSLLSASASLFIRNRALVLLLPVLLFNLLDQAGVVQIGGWDWTLGEMNGMYEAAGDEWKEFLRISAVNLGLSAAAVLTIRERLKSVI